MKSVSLPLAFLAVAFSALAALANATPVTARYFRFEGYATTATGVNAGRIRLYEIEAYANGVNVARNAAVTANSVFSGLSAINDGSFTGIFSSSSTNPGPPSEASPHWIQMDFGSAVPIDRTNVYVVGGDLITFGLFLSNDGVSWTQYGRYNQAGSTIQSDPSAPFVSIQSAAMRPGTTLMDVVYRVNDPDDATVKTRALAFVDGARSFANVIKPVTFVEGTAAKLGDGIPSNTNHTLTWDVGADWNIDLGQVKFEVLAMDGRGLLPIDWISIPAAGGNPALTISKDTPSNTSMLNAYFWQYAAGDTGLALTNGVLRGIATSGVFNNVDLVSGTAVQPYGQPFIFKRMNLAVADPIRVNDAINARAGLLNTNKWHVLNRTYDGISLVVAWGFASGSQDYGQAIIPEGLNGATAIAAGYYHSLVLKSDGTVVGWGLADRGATIPAGLSGVTAIAAGDQFSLALKSNGTVVQWGNTDATIPAGLSGVTAIATGAYHSLALKNDGTVVAWCGWPYGQYPVPAGLSGVIAIAARGDISLALKSDGTVVGWDNSANPIATPAGLSAVTAIAAGVNHCLALKSDGTVVAWGDNTYGQTAIPAGLSGVAAIAAGEKFSLALKSDGTVIAWGESSTGQTTIPAGLNGVTKIAVGRYQCFAIKTEAQ